MHLRHLTWLAPQPMCLVQNDWVSTQISKVGSWRDCRLLVREWISHESNHSAAEQKLPDLFVDAGANIGACTMEVLLSTNARVVAFEPNPNNLYHLTRTLNMLVERNASFAGRIAVLPVGLGSRAAEITITLQVGNVGNSILRAEDTPNMPHAKKLAGESAVRCANDTTSNTRGKSCNMGRVPVRRLDKLFEAPFPVRLMKMDVQGYECNVLRGASRFLDNDCMHTVTAEDDEAWLVAQHCSSAGLRRILTRNGTGGMQVLTSKTCSHCREQTMVARRTFRRDAGSIQCDRRDR